MTATRTVTARYQMVDGRPAHGEVWFVPSARLIDTDRGTTVIHPPITATLDAAGRISVQLPATDTTTLVAADRGAEWCWHVTEHVGYGQPWVYELHVPESEDPLDLSGVPRSRAAVTHDV